MISPLTSFKSFGLNYFQNMKKRAYESDFQVVVCGFWNSSFIIALKIPKNKSGWVTSN